MAYTRPDPENAPLPAPDAVRRPLTYASPTILARRQRILAETCALIGERGLHGFSLEDVAGRAGVAKRTVYNAFRSKDHLVAVAITRFVEDQAPPGDYRHDPATLDGVRERLEYGARRMPGLRPFAAALTAIHFSTDLDPEIREPVQRAAADVVEPWVMELARARQLEPWSEPRRVVDILIGFVYATVHGWVEGRFPAEALEVELVTGALSIIAGFARSKTRKEIAELLAPAKA